MQDKFGNIAGCSCFQVKNTRRHEKKKASSREFDQIVKVTRLHSYVYVNVVTDIFGFACMLNDGRERDACMPLTSMLAAPHTWSLFGGLLCVLVL